ncbi:MAG: hypothetical protein ABSH50_20750 [Bryobacteraceae bacterium]|jgi:hypothetical protein
MRHNDGVAPWLWFALFALPQAASSADLHCSTGPAFVIENQGLNGIPESRALVLWMCNPKKHEDEVYDHLYMCPDRTRGHFYRGETWLSLVDPKTSRVINTIPIRSDWPNEKTFDIPYLIPSFFYTIDGRTNKYGEGKPKILSLKDYNGGGDALEFALFEAENCTIVKTSLFGYSKSRDRVIQYPIHLTQRDGDAVTFRDSPWLDHFMLQKPISPGCWKWQQQYQEGCLTHFDIRYNRVKESFAGEVYIDHSYCGETVTKPSR